MREMTKRSGRRVTLVSAVTVLLLAVVVACTNLSASPPTTSTLSSADACRLNDKLVPSCGALWGIYAPSAPGQDWVTPFTDIERRIGRTFDIVKRYHDWSNSGDNGQFPDPSERALGGHGARILYFAWTSNIYANGSHVMWRDIAEGKYDASVIVPEARRIQSWSLPVFLDFDHEMDGQDRIKDGDPADYVAAYRHIHDVFVLNGVTNVIWVWTPTGWLGNAARIATFYPGDVYVDWIGYDPYNFYQCNGSVWQTSAQIISPFYNWLMENRHGNKPYLLAEYGSTDNPADPAALPNWYRTFAATVRDFPNIKAVIQFDAATSSACDFRITRSAAVLDAFASSAQSPYVNIR